MKEQILEALDEAEEQISQVRQMVVMTPTSSPPSEGGRDKEKTWSIKFDADNELYMALLLAAKRKRVSIKYLMLELVKEAGYPVDLVKAAEDGRRNR